MRYMLKPDVVRFFGTNANTARALGLTRGAITNWPARVPLGSALLAEKVSGGKLKFDPAAYGLDHVKSSKRVVRNTPNRAASST